MMMSRDALGYGSCPIRTGIFAVSMMLSLNIAELIPFQGNMPRRQGVRDLINGLGGWMG